MARIRITITISGLGLGIGLWWYYTEEQTLMHLYFVTLQCPILHESQTNEWKYMQIDRQTMHK